MAVYKCKMCGGALDITGETVAVCPYCGTQQTLPSSNDEITENLFNRANDLRLKCEFDKAEQVYERILNENNDEPEAHWGIVLCKYGIEYVVDPATKKRVPTCHRTSYEAVTTDLNYQAAIRCANAVQKAVYETEAKTIDTIQRNILAIVKNEKPFDVFICYKETDEHGKRTVDSALANDVYHQLTQEGLKVFFAAITLEDKLGQEYEPYIFAALNSAKVMVVVGTKPEHFSAVWVKNEWSRFLKLMKTDRSRLLIPCYRDMDAYELPEEFSHLQAQNMEKIGFINDIVRGIKKVVGSTVAAPITAAEVATPTVAAPMNAAVDALIDRAFMALEDSEFDRADEFCEQALNQDAKNVQAYLGKLMAELQVQRREQLLDVALPFDNRNNYQKVLRFADPELAAFLNNATEHIKRRNYEDLMDSKYQRACNAMRRAVSCDNIDELDEAIALFKEANGWKDSAAKIEDCLRTQDNIHTRKMNTTYSEARTQMERQGTLLNRFEYLEQAERLFRSLGDWKDAELQVANCMVQKDEIEKQLRAEEKAEEEQKKRRVKIVTISLLSVVATVVAVLALWNLWILPMNAYNNAEELLASGDYKGAAIYFGKIGNYSDARERSLALWDEIAVRDTVSAGSFHTVGLKADGTVVAVGDNSNGQCDVSDWSDIVAISAGYYHIVGLKADGMVVAIGFNYYGQCDVSNWSDIVAISAGSIHTVGLKADGTVVAVGDNNHGQCDVSDWNDIVAISAGEDHTVGLKADGTVVAVGANGYGQCDVSDWNDIVAISAGSIHTVGLKADGTVVAVGGGFYGQCDVSDWSDIVAISAGSLHTVGLKADGTVVAVGDNDRGQCDVNNWVLKVPDTP